MPVPTPGEEALALALEVPTGFEIEFNIKGTVIDGDRHRPVNRYNYGDILGRVPGWQSGNDPGDNAEMRSEHPTPLGEQFDRLRAFCEWTDEAMSVQVMQGPGGNVDWSQGYGFQMWRSRHGWRGDGAFGQLCLVIRDLDLVVAACAQVDDMQLELDLVWQHLLPGVYEEALPDDGTDLAAFLAARELPTIASTHEGAPGRYELTASGSAAAMVTASGFVDLDGTTLTFDDGTGPVSVPLGDGAWERVATTLSDGSVVHTAGTGGWTEPGILTAKIVPLHSPHVLLVRADTVAGTVDLDWQTQPLGTVSLARRALLARSFG